MIGRPQAPEIESACARLQEIPRLASDYTLTADEAGQRFGLDGTALDALRDAGLSGLNERGEPAYAHYDLYYLGLRLGVAREQILAPEIWRRSLERFVEDAETLVRVSYLPNIPDEAAAVSGRVILSDEERHDVELRHYQPAGEITATLRSSWPNVPADVRAVLDDVAALEFCLLPMRFWGDTTLARRLGITECWTAAHLVAEGCRRIGREARIVQGLIVGLPFSHQHAWAEVAVDGTWIPVDPVMVTFMCRYAGLDRASWPPHRSLGPLLVRICSDALLTPFVSRNGETVPTTYLTRRV